jgi:hypothetical protein
MRTVWILAIAGCGAPLEPEGFAIELIEWNADRLDDLKADIGYVESEVNASLSDGETIEVWNGSVAAEVDGGTWAATGTGEHTRTDDLFRSVSWDAEVTVDSVRIGGADVDGTYAWTVDENLFEGAFLTHTVVGSLTVEGDTLDVDLESQRSPSTTNWVRGSVGEATIDWENPTPDVP